MTVIPAPVQQECSKCSKCVEVLVLSDPNDFNNPTISSECKEDDCPINSNNQPKCDENVDIYFVDCDD